MKWTFVVIMSYSTYSSSPKRQAILTWFAGFVAAAPWAIKNVCVLKSGITSTEV